MSSGQRDTHIIPNLTEFSTRAPAEGVPFGDRVILFAAAACIEHGIRCRPLSRALDRIVEYRVRRR